MHFFNLCVDERIRRKGSSSKAMSFGRWLLEIGRSSEDLNIAKDRINFTNTLIKIPTSMVFEGTVKDVCSELYPSL